MVDNVRSHKIHSLPLCLGAISVLPLWYLACLICQVNITIVFYILALVVSVILVYYDYTLLPHALN